MPRPFDIWMMAEPLGHDGVSTMPSSPGSSMQRMATFSAWTPEAVTVISEVGSSSTPCSSE